MPRSEDSQLHFQLVPIDGDARSGVGRSAPPLPVFDLGADDLLPEFGEVEPALPSSATVPAGKIAPGKIVLNGDALMCGCPDCGAPMSIRLWLMIADCWMCGTSIELTEEQEREARRLLAQREAAIQKAESSKPRTDNSNKAEPTRPKQRTNGKQQTTPRAKAKEPTRERRPRPQPPEETPEPAAPTRPTTRPAQPGTNGHPRRQPTRPSSDRQRAATPAARIRARLARQSNARTTTAWLSNLFNDMPAWLISMLFHILLLILLALFTFGGDDDGAYITLSTTVAKDTQEGGETIIVDNEEIAFDLPIPDDVDMGDTHTREAVVKANQDARELRLDADAVEPNLPALAQVKNAVGSGHGAGSALAARDPRIRVDVVKREGGTTLTEAAVARGLRWMASHQNRDGSWSLDRFNHSAGCSCGGRGSLHSNSAGTSLALLPYLGAGQTHLVGRYSDTVARGVRWLIDNQRPNGDLRADSQGNSGMYAHGQAAIVLCEAFLMTGDEELRVPAQKAIDFIVAAQHPGGGWRYRPGQAGDTSVVGWQLMALQSARAAELNVPDETLELASQYLDSVSSRRGATYAYIRGQRPTHVMTAEALLCRIYMGWTLDDPALNEGAAELTRNFLPSEGDPNIYYWYYGTQTMHHVGGDRWTRWNKKMREILVHSQEKRGHAAGSWPPRGPHASAGGRLYMTALATCTLEVYYRHLPIFRQIELE